MPNKKKILSVEEAERQAIAQRMREEILNPKRSPLCFCGAPATCELKLASGATFLCEEHFAKAEAS